MKSHKITFDIHNGNEFVVTKDDETIRVFRQSLSGLYYMGTSDPVNYNAVLVETVEQNKSLYTCQDYLGAKQARKLQAINGIPSARQYKKIVESGLLPNCPVTVNNILAAEHIFGKDLGSLKGKTT